MEGFLRPGATIDRHLGEGVRYWREARGLTQSALAGYLGISARQLEECELGERRISAAHLFAVAHLLEVPVTAFFQGFL